jgi:saccharopine dehydrogenase-like NADP-dependent oxidoreductase
LADVFLLGATGLFGSRLARRLSEEGRSVVLAARGGGKLQALAAETGGTAFRLDRADAGACAIAFARHRPRIAIDAAGPFQDYGEDPYRFARQALDAGAHYLDLSDSAGFTQGIAALDGLARAKGLAALSGVSSTPALSSVIADALAEGLDQVQSIETAIVPGNRTERGYSVMRAILAEAGQSFRLRRGGRWEKARAWVGTRRIALNIGGRKIARLAALHPTPETAIFPARYGAKTAEFRAGLELPLLHRGLSALAWLVRLRLLKTLAPLAKPLYALASALKGFGTDLGGMRVAVRGRTGEAWTERVWTLLAPDGIGPNIPAEPAALLAAKLLRGEIAPGARPALGEFTLAEAEAALHALGILTERAERPLPSLFAAVLGADFAALAPPVRALHAEPGLRSYAGEADIDGPEGLLARLAARIAGFPPPGRGVPLRVTIEAAEARETWTRDFAGRRFRSVLKRRGGSATERFGPFVFTLGLAREGDRLAYPVISGRFLWLIPLPRFLLPKSETWESADAEGRFTFDVRLNLSWGPRITHYQGFLVPEAADPGPI